MKIDLAARSVKAWSNWLDAAKRLAAERSEPVTSLHLLATLIQQDPTVAGLLRDRRIDAGTILRGSRSVTESAQLDLQQIGVDARAQAARYRRRDIDGLSILLALLAKKEHAATTALEHCGVEINRLRLATMNLSMANVAETIQPMRSRQNQPVVDDPSFQSRIALPRSNSGKGTIIPTTPQLPPFTAKLAASIVPVSPLLEKKTQENPKSKVKDSSLPSNRVSRVNTVASGKSSKQLKQEEPVKSRLLSQELYPALARFTTNHTEAASDGLLDPVVGRDREVEMMLDVLGKREGNNPLLLGPAGVGKTSVVRALAIRECREAAPRMILELRVSDLLADTGTRGALAQRFKKIRQEVESLNPGVVLFVDEIHQLFIGDGADEIQGEIKLALLSGKFPLIGATTDAESRKSIEADPAVARRFTRIEIAEPSVNDAIHIAEKLCEALAEHHGIRYSGEAIEAAVRWSSRYMPSRVLPEKAVFLLDWAGARGKRTGLTSVSEESVADVLSEYADIPSERLLESDQDRMLRLEELVAERLIGHKEKVARIGRCLRRNAAGLKSRGPLGSFLLLGPTGVGKTETAKALAEILFGSATAMTRIDLSEYSEAHAVAKLMGAPPGYLGHEAGGLLTNAVERRPYQVLLLDELEKAHSDVLQSFLAMLDEGTMTDGRGKRVDFSNTLIMMTSNLGAKASAVSSTRRVGFLGSAERHNDSDLEREKAVIDSARQKLAPEFYNRIDDVLVYQPLDDQQMVDIANLMMERLGKQLYEEKQLIISMESKVPEWLVEHCFEDRALGARPLQRAVQRLIESPLADLILMQRPAADTEIAIRICDSELQLELLSASAAATA